MYNLIISLAIISFLEKSLTISNNSPVIISSSAVSVGVPTSSFGEQVKKARLQKKITQEELAAKIGLSTNNIISIEENRAVPIRSFITKLEEILNVPLNIEDF